MEVRYTEITTSVEPPRWIFLVDYGDRMAMPKKGDVEARVGATQAWCEDQFGPMQYLVWHRQVGGFFFWREADATAFKLRWC